MGWDTALIIQCCWIAFPITSAIDEMSSEPLHNRSVTNVTEVMVVTETFSLLIHIFGLILHNASVHIITKEKMSLVI